MADKILTSCSVSASKSANRARNDFCLCKEPEPIGSFKGFLVGDGHFCDEICLALRTLRFLHIGANSRP